jgi:hypothetical protein
MRKSYFFLSLAPIFVCVCVCVSLAYSSHYREIFYRIYNNVTTMRRARREYAHYDDIHKLD